MSAIMLGAVGILCSVFFQNCAKDGEISSIEGNSLASLSGSANYVGTAVNGQTIGHLDSVTYTNGQLIYRGWACKVGSDEQIKVYFGVGEPEGSEVTRIYDHGDTIADVAGEPAVANVCQSSHGNHRFSYATNKLFAKLGGWKIQFIGWTNPGNVPFAEKGVLSSNTKITGSEVCDISNSYCADPAAIPPALARGSAIGFIDEVREDQGRLLIRGWTCTVGYEGPSSVHINTDGMYGRFHVDIDERNMVQREPAVATACQTSYTRHGFEIFLNQATRSMHRGRTIIMYGSSRTAVDPSQVMGIFYELGNSGKFTVF